MPPIKLRDRHEIPLEHRYATEDIFADDHAWQQAIDAVKAKLTQLASYRGRLATGPDTIRACLDLADEIHHALARITLWPRLCYAVDSGDAHAAARQDRARALAADAAATLAFIDPELIAIGVNELRGEPALAEYDRLLEKLAHRAPHVLSDELEGVLGLASDAFATAEATHAVLVNTDLRYPEAVDSQGQRHELTVGTVRRLECDGDRELRRSAWTNYHDTLLAHRNTLANTVSASIKQITFSARVRGHASSLDAAMHRHELPRQAFDNLMETFRGNLGVWQRYWRLRREALSLDAMHPWDILAPLNSSLPYIELDQAIDWIAEALAPLGEAYVETVTRGCREQRWVDVFPNRGKRMGAFCSTDPGGHPYVFVNYHGTLSAVSTLAHELGHAMHGHLTHKHQRRMHRTGYGQFPGETAAIFHQALLRHHLFETNADPALRLAIAEEAMANFHRYMFLMPMLGQFEQRIHGRVERQEPTTADVMNQTMAELFAEGYGGEVDFEPDRTGIIWAAFPTHITKNFYTFTYALGIAAAHALARQVIDEGASAAGRYLELLGSGGAEPPMQRFARFGIDITRPEPIQAAFDVLDQWIDQVETLLPSVSPS